MKILRFTESEEFTISTERVGEIIEELKDFISNIDDKNKIIEGYINELSNFKSNSKKGNNQIDDSIIALQIVARDLDNSIDKIDTTINNLMDYNEKGEDFLYTGD